MLLYDYQYDVAGILALILLVFIMITRRGFRTNSYKIFISIIILNLITAVSDLFSIFTISNPQDYPLWLNEFVSLLYLYAINLVGCMVYLYIYVKSGITKIRLLSTVLEIGLISYYTVIIFSSPWTHLIAYFDENGNYCHGPLYMSVFAVNVVLLILELIIFALARKRFNRYQMIASYTLIFAMLGGLVIQNFYKRTLILSLLLAIVLYFIYIAYENPVYYTYRSTSCLNRHALFETLRYVNWRKNADCLYAIQIADYDYVHFHMDTSKMDEVTNKIAEFLSRNFGRHAFVYDESTYLVLLPGKNKDTQSSIYLIDDFIDRPIETSTGKVKINFDKSELQNINELYKPDELEEVVRYWLQHIVKGKTDAIKLVDTVIEENNHKQYMLYILKKAIAEGKFEVYYQPIYDVKLKKFRSAEALLRLKDEKLGFVDPEELVRIAESNDYIEDIGQIVMRKVCHFISESGLEELGVEYIEVNLSPAQCIDMQIQKRFKAIMDEYGVRPDQLNLEITETAEIHQEEKLAANLSIFEANGFSLSIDDYGSGFASEDYLIRFPVSIVKIDKYILWNAMKQEKARIVLKHTVLLIHELKKEIVVEGVENVEMVAFLTELGVDFFQGYYYSKAIPEEQYVQFLKDKNFK